MGIEMSQAPVPDGVIHPCDRSDPFWNGTWRSSGRDMWSGALVTPRLMETRGMRVPGWMRYDPDYRPLTGRGAGRRRAALLAAARMWGTLTIEQAAAVTGCTTKEAVNDAHKLITANLVEWGAPYDPWAKRSLHAGSLLRATDRRYLTPHLKQMLWTDQLSLTGGRGWVRASAGSRHNCLTVELALRATSLLGVPMAVGEMLAGADDLLGTGAGREELEHSRYKRADAVLVRRDGVRIVIETTASATPRLGEKIDAWASLLASRPGSGVIVCVLAAPPVDGSFSVDLASDVASKVSASVTRYRGVSSDPVCDHLMVASWRDWFPAPGEMSTSFLSMEATGFTPSGERVRSGLLTHEVPGGDGSVMAAASYLAGVPWYCRRGGIDPVMMMVRRYTSGSTSSASDVLGEPTWPEALRPLGRTAVLPGTMEV